MPIGTLLDRGWPDYDSPFPLDHPGILNYRAFAERRSARGELRVERFEAGRADQIALRRNAARYADFEVRNLAVNGAVWTGEGWFATLLRESTRIVIGPRADRLACTDAHVGSG